MKNMKLFGILLPFVFIIWLQVFKPVNGVVIRKPSNVLLEAPPMPLALRQLTFNVGTASGREPNGILSANIAGGMRTLGEASLNLLRRGSLIAADALVNVLSGLATFINMIQNYAQSGSIQFDNLSSSSQAFTNRLLNLGSNTATTIMNTLSNEMSTSGNNGASSSSGLNLPVSSSSQFIASGGAPITQTDAGRQSTLAWPQGSMTLFPFSASSTPGIWTENLSLPTSQSQWRDRLEISSSGRPAVTSSTSSVSGGSSLGVQNGAGGSASTGPSGWLLSGGRISGWGSPGIISSSSGTGMNTGSGDAGNVLGWNGSGSAFGWRVPVGSVGWGGPGAAAGWGGTNGVSAFGGADGMGSWGTTNGWDSSSSIDTDVDDMDVINTATMYGATNSNNNTSAIPSLSTLAQTTLNPLETLINEILDAQTTEGTVPPFVSSLSEDTVTNRTLTS